MQSGGLIALWYFLFSVRVLFLFLFGVLDFALDFSLVWCLEFGFGVLIFVIIKYF